MNQNQPAAEQPLAGKRVAVIVESQYIPQELQIYRERFEKYGATVDFVSHLGDPKLPFYSTVEPGVVDELHHIEVNIDFDDVKPSDYAAIIAAANYTTVRLRYVDTLAPGPAPRPGTDPREQIRNAPAVRFFREAMKDPRIVKGAPCHALWLLTPSPEVLRGRRVTCHSVVLADVLNAGAEYVGFPLDTPDSDQVHVDDDLVTNTNWRASQRLVDAIKDIIVKNQQAAPPRPAGVTP
jgi:putative intracellular protease/amidase